jgi:uncharacterized protein YdhG (YjbR/CyaY superfamily)
VSGVKSLDIPDASTVRAGAVTAATESEMRMSEKKTSGKVLKTKRKQNPARNESKAGTGFTDEERAAMREYAQERKAAARRGGRGADRAEGENDLLAKIAQMPEPDRTLAQRLHALVKATAPSLVPRTWYGMPAYANDDGHVVCFFQSGQKFKTRYATLGFSDKAKLDDGNMWPTAFALKELTGGEEARVRELVKKALG